MYILYGMIWYDMIWYDMIFIYSNWVSTRWQWSVNLYKNRNEIDIYISRNNTQNNTKTKNIQNKKKHTKQEHKYKRNIKKHKSNNYKRKSSDWWHSVLHRTYIHTYIRTYNYINVNQSEYTHFTQDHHFTSIHFTSLPIIHFPSDLDVSSPSFKIPSLLLTYNWCPTPFLKICGLQLKVAGASAGSWFHSLIVLSCLQSTVYRYQFFVSFH